MFFCQIGDDALIVYLYSAVQRLKAVSTYFTSKQILPFVFAKRYCSQYEGPSQQTQNICITFVQRRPNVFDVSPTLYKCYTNVFRLLGMLFHTFQVVWSHRLKSLPCMTSLWRRHWEPP